MRTPHEECSWGFLRSKSLLPAIRAMVIVMMVVTTMVARTDSHNNLSVRRGAHRTQNEQHPESKDPTC